MAYSLKELKEIIEYSWNFLSWTLEPIQTNVSLSTLKNCDDLRDIIEKLDKTGLFEEQLSFLLNSELFSKPGDEIRIAKDHGLAIDRQLTMLNGLLKNIDKAFTQIIPEESKESINIKLPPVNDFNDLSEYSKELHTALSQVLYLDEINSNVKIESVENGSIWLNVLFTSSLAMTVVGSLVWSAAVIYKKMLEARMMEQQLRGLTIRNDSLDDIMKAQKESLALLIQGEAELINSQTFKVNLPENTERVKNSIKIFAGLLDKGAEIHPAIGAPEEIANLYPKIKSLATIESKTKQLKA